MIYTPVITSRIEYIIQFLFHSIMGIEVKITSSIYEFNEYQGNKIVYAPNPIGNSPFIESVTLLTENIIEIKTIPIAKDNGYPQLFPTSKKSILPFDIFAASFYLITRYEEYYPTAIRDNHHRYLAKNSIAVKEDFLHLPIIDLWAYQLREILVDSFKLKNLKRRSYQFIPTFDVDIAYAYNYKGIVRHIGSLGQKLLSLESKNIIAHLKTIAGLKKDPYDTYQYIINSCKPIGTKPIFFILLGNKSKLDKNLNWKNKGFQKLIKRLKEHCEIGIHLSYQSNDNTELKKIETNRLKHILKKPVSKNRQHFLMLELPKTLLDLTKLGITDDYTMGYAETAGFRAGTCTPFKFYDLTQDKTTDLTIHPFAFMEGTFMYYLKNNPEQTLVTIKSLISEIKKVDGTLYSLWHNHTLADTPEQKEWRALFETVLQIAQ